MRKHVFESYFHKNPFFAITPLSGWSFIYAAKTSKEVFLWYVIILTFVGLTIYNVHQVTVYFLSAPTKISVELQSSTEHVYMPNMTMTLTLPMLEFLQHLPMPFTLSNKKSKEMEWSEDLTAEANDRFRIFRDFMCNNPSWTLETEQETYEDKLTKLIFNSGIEFSNLISMGKAGIATSLSNSSILKDWTASMNASSEAIISYWLDLLAKPSNEQDRSLVRMDLAKLHSSETSKRPNSTLLKLLTLDAIRKDQDPRFIFMGIYNETISTNNINIRREQEAVSGKMWLKRLSTSTNRLLQDVVADLAQLIHVSIVPHGSVWLQDWSLIRDTDVVKEMGSFLVYKLLVELPKGTKQVQIKVYSYMYMWNQYLVSALERVLVSDLVLNGSTVSNPILGCREGQWFLIDIVDLIAKWQSHYTKFSNLILSLLNGKDLFMNSLYEWTWQIAPSLLLKSKTQNCFEEDLSICIEECMHHSLLESCGCLPWTMSHNERLAIDSKVCDMPCDDTAASESCNSRCSNAINNPCNLLLTRVNSKKKELIFDGDEILVANILTSGAITHAQLTKEYEMTTNTYLSLLGGSIEFWCAIDVLGLIHLVVYVVLRLFSCCFGGPAPDDAGSDGGDSSIEEIEDHCNNCLASIREKTKIEKSDKNTKSLLMENRFYGQTPITGFSMINAAQSLLEAIFWYGIIAFFAVMTMVNVQAAFQHYASKPTYSTFLPKSKNNKHSIPNITLEIKLPFEALTPLEMSVPYDVQTLQYWGDLYDFYYFDDDLYTKYDPEDHVSMLDDYFLQAFNHPLAMGKLGFFPQLSFSDKDRISNFKSLLKNSYMKLMEYLLYEDETSAWLKRQTQMPKLFQGPVSAQNFPPIISELLLLEDLLNGRQNHSSLVTDVLKGSNLTVEQLHAATVSHLSRLLVIEIPTGGQAFLSKMTFDKNVYANLQFEMRFAPGLETHHINIESLKASWMATIEDHMYDLWNAGFMDSYVLNAKILYHHNSITERLNHLREESRATLQFPDGSYALIRPETYKREYSIEIKWEHIGNYQVSTKKNFYWVISLLPHLIANVPPDTFSPT